MTNTHNAPEFGIRLTPLRMDAPSVMQTHDRLLRAMLGIAKEMMKNKNVSHTQLAKIMCKSPYDISYLLGTTAPKLPLLQFRRLVHLFMALDCDLHITIQPRNQSEASRVQCK